MPSHAVWSPVHRLVERVAAADPHAVAVRHGELSVTRGDLVERSRSLAAHLLSRGVAPGSVVAVRLDRSIEHIVACLAILQAGSAFMSIDPSDPTDRARRLVANAGAAAIITDPTRAADHPEPAIRIDAHAAADADALPNVTGEHLAYVAHTSGSAGEPNAVEITHANLANLIAWTHETFSIGPEDRVTLALGLGFDAAIWELWPALAAGATVHVLDDIVRTSPELLRAYWLDERITFATVPTALAEALIAADWPADAPLRALFTGGDVLRSRPREGLPFALVNNYGPTECTCETTWAVVSPVGAGLPPIGRPIAGVAVHLLDEAQRPVAPGAEGDIWIGGRSLGRGYRNNPELTAAKFRPDPFSVEPDARMYRTGDRGRWLPGGELAFCGRADRQVKIAGVRIELDEVAAALQTHADVGTAIVTAREDARGSRALVAHVVSKPGRAPDAMALRRHLAERLPRSYIPRAFVAIDAVPLTRNGKIDTAALPEPVLSTARPAAAEPASGPERTVLAIVRDVLGDDGVALADNFFLLGGHSLQATEVVVRCRAAFGVQVALADLFGAESIGGFVAAICERVERWVAALSDQDVAAALGRR